MKTRTLLLSLITIFVLLTLIVSVSAQTRKVGVSAGNKFRYSVTASWNSNDPDATIPSSIVDLQNTQWEEITITAISGTNVSGRTTDHFNNNTEYSIYGWVDVNTGAGNNLNPLFVSTNLFAGNPVYTSSPFNTWFINESVHRTYLSGARLTNGLHRISSSGNETYVNDIYWDTLTGAAVETGQEITNQSGEYVTTTLTHSQIVSSNVWTVPEFPNGPVSLVMLVALIFVSLVVLGRKPKTP